MSSLPHDIIVDILLRLPVKSLLRFRCVSRCWKALISDPVFVKLHLNRSFLDPRANRSRLLTFFPFWSPSLFDDEEPMGDLGFPWKQPGSYGAKVMGSCNGLVCLLYNPNTIILWNPSTRDFKELPSPPCSASDISFYGIGYVSSMDDYKVVLAARPVSADKTQPFIFNLKGNNCWRGIEQGLRSSITMLDDVGTFFNGALHWRATWDFGLTNQEAIIALDMEEEKFRVILQPEVDDERIVSFHTLGVSQGCLSLCSYSYGLHVGIWEMKKYGDRTSWTMVASLRSNEFDFCDYVVPVCFTKNGELVVDLDGRKLVKYNIQEKKSRSVKNWIDDWFQWIMYVESLVTPHGKS